MDATDETRVEVRPIVAEEVPLLRSCLEGLAAYHNRLDTAFSGVYPTMPIENHLEHMKDHIVNDSALIVGVFPSEGGLAGFGMASFEGAYGEIDYLFLDGELRGEGWGERILEMLLAYLRRKGAGFVDVKVVRENPAVRFYEKFDFTPRCVTLSTRL